MATLNTNIATIEKDTPRVRPFPAGKRFPKFFVAEAIYTVTGDELAADIIDIIKLPQGSRVIPYLSNVTAVGAVATTLTLDIGDDILTAEDGSLLTDPDAYADGLNTAAAGNDLFTSGAQPAAQNVPRILTRDAWIQATLATLDTPVKGTTLVFNIVYSTLHEGV